MLSKFYKKFAEKWLVFSIKSNFAKSLFIFLWVSTALLGYENALYEAWFTGPIVAFQAKATPVGKTNFQPYIAVQSISALYTPSWQEQRVPSYTSVIPYLFLSTGLAEDLEIEFILQAEYNTSQGRDYLNVGDQAILLEYVLLHEDEKSLQPAVAFGLQEIFPTGNYHRLDPGKLLVDWTGGGSFGTLVACFLQKLFLLPNKHLFNLYINAFFTYFTATHVSGFNAYGGGFGTYGRVRPGCQTVFLISGEYQLTQNWVIASDFVYAHINRDHFYGNPGQTYLKTTASVGNPSREQFSIAPSIEYNFNSSMGAFCGVWFSYSGRNANVFITPVVSLSVTF